MRLKLHHYREFSARRGAGSQLIYTPELFGGTADSITGQFSDFPVPFKVNSTIATDHAWNPFKLKCIYLDAYHVLGFCKVNRTEGAAQSNLGNGFITLSQPRFWGLHFSGSGLSHDKEADVPFPHFGLSDEVSLTSNLSADQVNERLGLSTHESTRSLASMQQS
jgi:hypothetical protein